VREKGFTLIETLATLAITSLLLAVIVLTIYTIIVTNDRGNDRVTALTDINGAVYAIKNDLMMAQDTDLTIGVPKNSVNLEWYDYTSSFGTDFQTYHSSSYQLVGRELQRTYDGDMSIVGRNVISLSFEQSIDLSLSSIAVIISTSDSPDDSRVETLQFSVHLRSEEIE
jgi:prepilin-type N-terminal cleavage/methylation domain-containing protein